MKAVKLFKWFTGLLCIAALPLLCRASDGTPVRHFNIALVKLAMPMDTVAPKPVPENNTITKPAEDLIKAVPKARRQAVPIPVTVKVQVKPVIIKPKIIKPVIRILH